jgi:hypothetical protein
LKSLTQLHILWRVDKRSIVFGMVCLPSLKLTSICLFYCHSYAFRHAISLPVACLLLQHIFLQPAFLLSTGLSPAILSFSYAYFLLPPVSLPVCCQSSWPPVSLSPACLNIACLPACCQPACYIPAFHLSACLFGVYVPLSLLRRSSCTCSIFCSCISIQHNSYMQRLVSIGDRYKPRNRTTHTCHVRIMYTVQQTLCHPDNNLLYVLILFSV